MTNPQPLGSLRTGDEFTVRGTVLHNCAPDSDGSRRRVVVFDGDPVGTEAMLYSRTLVVASGRSAAFDERMPHRRGSRRRAGEGR